MYVWVPGGEIKAWIGVVPVLAVLTGEVLVWLMIRGVPQDKKRGVSTMH